MKDLVKNKKAIGLQLFENISYFTLGDISQHEEKGTPNQFISSYYELHILDVLLENKMSDSRKILTKR